MKYTTLTLLTLLCSITTLDAQQLVELCRDDKVAAVISQINSPCEFKTDRKEETKKSPLRSKDDLHKKLLAGQQLQCTASDKKTKNADEGCITIYLCGSRQDKPVTAVDPEWFTVVNVPDSLPRGDTRPGSVAFAYPSNFWMLPSTPGISSSVVADYAFRPENPEAGNEKIGFSHIETDLMAANYARDSGKFQLAQTYYRRALTENPADARPLVGIGNIYADLGQWRKAEEAYRMAMESNPAISSAYSSLGYVLLEGQTGVDDSRLAEAEAFARHAIRLQPKSAATHDLLAVILEKQGKGLNEAEQLYKQAIQINPSSSIFHFHLSRLLKTLGRNEEAARHYSLALSLTDPQTLMLIAERFQSESHFQLSEAPLDRVLKSEADNPRALYLLSKALVYRKEYAGAVQILKKVSQLDPARFEVQRLLGFTYVKMNMPEDAEIAFGAAAKLGSSEQRKLLVGMSDLGGVAELYLTLKRRRDAVRVYATALSLDPNNARIKEAASKQ